jgi:hypothetical protein
MVKYLQKFNLPNPAHFIIVHDQDKSDCVELKNRLQEKADSVKSGVIVRIACRELEAWHLGDIEAVCNAFGSNKKLNLSNKREFRNPDKIIDPKEKLIKNFPKYGERSWAQAIAEQFDAGRNASKSFNVFYKSLSDAIKQLLLN